MLSLCWKAATTWILRISFVLSILTTMSILNLICNDNDNQLKLINSLWKSLFTLMQLFKQFLDPISIESILLDIWFVSGILAYIIQSTFIIEAEMKWSMIFSIPWISAYFNLHILSELYILHFLLWNVWKNSFKYCCFSKLIKAYPLLHLF